MEMVPNFLFGTFVGFYEICLLLCVCIYKLCVYVFVNCWDDDGRGRGRTGFFWNYPKLKSQTRWHDLSSFALFPYLIVCFL